VAEREVGGEGVLKLTCCLSEEALLCSPRGEPAVEIPLTAAAKFAGWYMARMPALPSPFITEEGGEVKGALVELVRS
jgi:hypothetical protein